MIIFPCGTVSAASNTGTVDSVSYSIFEPNNGCSSQTIHNILTTVFENKMRLTRKKGQPYIIINYKYNFIKLI